MFQGLIHPIYLNPMLTATEIRQTVAHSRINGCPFTMPRATIREEFLERCPFCPSSFRHFMIPEPSTASADLRCPALAPRRKWPLRGIALLILGFHSLWSQDPTPTPEEMLDTPPLADTEATRQFSPRDLAVIREARKTEPAEVYSSADLGLSLPRISAIKAARVTMDYSPQIQLQGTEVQTREGGTRIAQGPFDTTVTGKISADLKQRERDEFPRPTPAPSPATAPTTIPNPLVNRVALMNYEAGLRKRLRNGIVVEPKVGVRQQRNTDYNSFNNNDEGYVSFDVLIPLAKGGGRLVNEAPEIAARFDLLASVLQLRHISSLSIRDTIQAYWQCHAAEARYKLFLESEQISSRLASLGASLVEADELAPAQLPQIIADRATTVADRVRGATDLILARQRLAIAIGYNPESLVMAPLPSDDFPKPPENDQWPNLNELWTTALLLRDDLRAAKRLESSRKVLMDASFLELRPRIDLQLSATYLPFETRTTQSVSDGNELRGYAALALEWPIENNAAIGRFIQDSAAYERTGIDIETLKRSIISGVISALAQLKGAAAEIAYYQDAQRLNTEALQAQEELFRLGQANLTDTITTRQRLIQSQLNYINAQERYAISLAQLRFETATLFFVDESGSWIDAKAWQTIPFQSRQ